MSGSDDAADVAEMRKLQAQLREAKDGLSDTYYSHSKDSKSQALDDELDAYQKSAEDYVETLREQLENTEAMIEQTFSDVLLNADVTYQELIGISDKYGPTLSTNLMNPWYQMGNEATRVKGQIGEDILSLNEDNIAPFSENAEFLLETPFEQGGLAAERFQITTSAQITAIQTQVYTASSQMFADLSFPWDSVASADGPINTFSKTVESKLTGAVLTAKLKASEMSNSLKSPWNDGVTAINTWSREVENALNKAVKQAQDAAKAINAAENSAKTPSYTAGSVTGGVAGAVAAAGGGSGYNNGGLTATQIKELQKYLEVTQDGKWGSNSQSAAKKKWGVTSADEAWKKYGTTARRQFVENASSTKSISADIIDLYIVEKYGIKYVESGLHPGHYYEFDQAVIKNISGKKYYNFPKGTPLYRFYAKGTLGTKQDEWAYTDEPWLGDELVLIPGANGNLQYMRKGTAVMPADISANLVEWGKINPDMTALANGVQGVNLMSNYVSKPEIKLNIDNFLRCDNVSQDTLPELKKFVNEQMNSLVKQLNYGLKRSGA